MAEQFVKSVVVNIRNTKFYCSKHPVNVSDVDIGKIPVADEFAKNKETDVKQIKRHKTSKKIRPLLITLPQLSGFLNKFEKTQYM